MKKKKKKKKNNKGLSFENLKLEILKEQEYEIIVKQYDKKEFKRDLCNEIKENFELNYKSDLIQYTTKLLLDICETGGIERQLNEQALERIDDYNLSDKEQEILYDINYQLECRSVRDMSEFASTKVEEIILDLLDNYIVEEIDKICKAKSSYKMSNYREDIEEIVDQFSSDIKNDIIMESENEFKSYILTYFIDYRVYDILECLKEKLEEEIEELEDDLTDSMKEYKEKIDYLEDEKKDLENELKNIKSDEKQNHIRINEINEELFSIEEELNFVYECIIRFEEKSYDETQIGEIEELEEKISKIEGWMEKL